MAYTIIALYYFFLLSTLSAFGIFDHDRAIAALRNNDPEKALALISQAIASGEKNPTLLYDAGVITFTNKQYRDAQNYFTMAAGCLDAPRDLQNKAYFNLGNSFVKEWEEQNVGSEKIASSVELLHNAIGAYEKSLTVEPDNERTLNNIEYVKKLLEQEKQKDQNNQEQSDDKHNDSSKQENNANDQQKSDNQSNQEDSGQNKDDEQSNQNPKSEDKDNKQEKQEKASDSGHRSDPENNGQSNAQKNNSQRNVPEKTACEQKPYHDPLAHVDPVLAQLLDQEEDHEHGVQKQLIQRMVDGMPQGAKNNGQNSW